MSDPPGHPSEHTSRRPGVAMVPAAAFFGPGPPLLGIAFRLALCTLPSVLLFQLWVFVSGGVFGVGFDLFSIAATILGLLVGAPLYLVFWRRDWHAWWQFVVAALVPAPLIFFLIANPLMYSQGTRASYGDCDMIDHGALTACGWIGYISWLSEFALLGGTAGLVFWLLLRLRWRLRS